MCNCNNTTTTTQNHVCKPKCPPQEDCTCPVQIKSSCVTMYDGNDLECSGIQSGLPLNQTIELLDNYICEAIDEINTSINLVNVGEGEDIYAGIDGIGRRKIRTLTSTGNSVTITQGTDTINLEVDIEPTTICLTSKDKTVSITEEEGCFDLKVNLPTSVNVGTGEDVYKTFNLFTNQNEFKTLKSNNSTIVLSPSTDELSLEVNNLQKTINTFPYTIQNIDDKHTLFINNNTANVSIIVPDGLIENFCCCIIQEGTADVTVTATDLRYPPSAQNILKEQYSWGLIEKKLGTTTYFLIGNLKAI